LIYIHEYVNILFDKEDQTFISSDDVMIESFGGQIPAMFFIYRDQMGRSIKILMEEAVRNRFINAPLNTYEIITALNNDFNPTKFKNHYIQTILALNLTSAISLQKYPEFSQQLKILNKDDIRNKMTQEHQIIKQVMQNWKYLFKQQRKQIIYQQAISHQISSKQISLTQSIYQQTIPQQTSYQ
jgi:hypothetical protein